MIRNLKQKYETTLRITPNMDKEKRKKTNFLSLPYITETQISEQVALNKNKMFQKEQKKIHFI